MKILNVVAAVTLTWSAAAQAQTAQPAVDAQELAEARSIIAVMFPPQQRDAQVRAMMADLTKQSSAAMDLDKLGSDPGLRKIFDTYLAGIPDKLMPLVREHFPRILEATAIAYTNEFTLEELRELNRFAATPTGAHYLSRSSALLGDPAVAAANTAYFAALRTVQQKEVESLRQQVMAYLKANPGAAKR